MQMDDKPKSYDPAPLRQFVGDLAHAVTTVPHNEPQMLQVVTGLMRKLVSSDTWLPAVCARPHDTYYQQHLLYGDPLDRFSVVSFVWGPGQETPIHDHTVWGVIGMLRGSEIAEQYAHDKDTGRLVQSGVPEILQPGDVAVVSPSVGDIHRVRNAYNDRVSISIHVYGGNIGKVSRHVFNSDGTTKDFISGYSNTLAPNLWAPATT